jgi:hypothetical protein
MAAPAEAWAIGRTRNALPSSPFVTFATVVKDLIIKEGSIAPNSHPNNGLLVIVQSSLIKA